MSFGRQSRYSGYGLDNDDLGPFFLSFFVIFHSAPNPEKVRPRKRQLGAIMYIIYATWLDHVYNLTRIEFLSILIHALGRIKTLPPSQPGCMSFRSDPPGTVHWESTLYIDHLSWVLGRGLHAMFFRESMCGKH